jgi:cytochrome c
VTITAPGTHVVSYRSTDRAGQVKATKMLTVTVADRDTTGPTLVVTGLTDGADYGHSREPVLGWSTTPTGHPVQSVTARLDGGAVSAGRLGSPR